MAQEPDRPDLRAADLDRELTASQLRRHAAAGRLTLAELDERLGWTYQAKTMGELAKLTSDLPDLSVEKLPVEQAASAPQEAHKDDVERRSQSGGLNRVVLGSYLSTNFILIAIWLIVGATSGSWYPWWLWVAGPWGAVILANEIRNRTQGTDGGSTGR